jgi:hypothetical protein
MIPNADRCEETEDGDYSCIVRVGGVSDGVSRRYTVEVGRSGCWTAEPVQARNPEIDGCVRLWNFLFAD